MYIHTARCGNMLHGELQTVKRLSVKWWTPLTLSGRHLGYVVERESPPTNFQTYENAAWGWATCRQNFQEGKMFLLKSSEQSREIFLAGDNCGQMLRWSFLMRTQQPRLIWDSTPFKLTHCSAHRELHMRSIQLETQPVASECHWQIIYRKRRRTAEP